MAKIADRYFTTDPWYVIEEGFNPEYSQVAESVFSLGNEYMGLRGYFDEGYTGKSLTGNYFNGIYGRQEHTPSAYKGIADSTEFMVNAVNWIYTRIYAGDELLDLGKSSFSGFRRELDMKNGILSRSFIWTTSGGNKINLKFERFLSMKHVHIGAQRISITPLGFDGEIRIIAGLDFSEPHQSFGQNFWDCSDIKTDDGHLSILGTVKTTGQKLFSSCRFSGDFYDKLISQKEISVNEKAAAREFTVQLREGSETTFVRIASNLACQDMEGEAYQLFERQRSHSGEELKLLDYEVLKEENISWWNKVWNKSDIVIRGDELNQQGIRFCIFQMFQTYHGAKKGTNIGAKGLTGEAYSGNAFWDTEVYCLPFFIFNNPEAAKNLLIFRYVTLPEAKERAGSLDCKGAFYPIATISGRECCNLWQHASLQLQASTAVAYGIWFYEKITGDKEFLLEYGLPMLVEICRMLATRGSWTEGGKKYGYYCVMGPDEFQMMVNHNCYTNYMGRFTFNYTLKVLDELKNQASDSPTEVGRNLADKERSDELLHTMGLTADECSEWSRMADCMYIPYDNDTQLFEQHDGYFKLPHVDIGSIPVEDFPLYHHWSYDRIYRNDMIKQPDVLMVMLMFNASFAEETIRRNYEFYEPRCIHESSLSPSVHSILAAQIKKHAEAYEFFKFATRLDLDNYNRNAYEGLHTTSIAAAWMNIVYGFGGMRSDGSELSFSPSVPNGWDGYSFRISYRNNVIFVDVSRENVTFRTSDDTPVSVNVYGKPIVLGREAEIVPIPLEWRG